MQEELDALLRNQTWTLIPKPSNKKIIGCKYVYKIKRNSDGSIARYKARLVAKGFHQTADINYTETFSLIVKSITIHVLLTLALSSGWSLRQVDINHAFLHGLLYEEVLMSQPLGMEVTGAIPLVCKLHKALYGLKQAPRAWFDRLGTFLRTLGFSNSRADSYLFFRHSGTSQCYVLIYVDDMVITGSS